MSSASHDPDRPRASLPRTVAIAFALVVLVACSSGGGSPSFRGDVLSSPIALPTQSFSATTASSTAATSTTLASLQKGHLLLVYFGYTNCPDVCPATMAALATALRTMPSQYSREVQVAFVTSDPARDTVPVMRNWLANFDPAPAPAFVGLTSSVATIDAAAKSVGVPLVPPVKQKDGTYAVSHGAQVLAFVGGMADHLWLAGTSPKDYEHDLPELVRGGLT